jgi:hypothetical protein
LNRRKRRQRRVRAEPEAAARPGTENLVIPPSPTCPPHCQRSPLIYHPQKFEQRPRFFAPGRPFLAGVDFVRNRTRRGGEPMAAVKALVPVVAIPRADVWRPDAPRCAGECVRRVWSIATDHPENAAIVMGSGEPAKTGAACAHRCLGRWVRIEVPPSGGGNQPGLRRHLSAGRRRIAVSRLGHEDEKLPHFFRAPLQNRGHPERGSSSVSLAGRRREGRLRGGSWWWGCGRWRGG